MHIIFSLNVFVHSCLQCLDCESLPCYFFYICLQLLNLKVFVLDDIYLFSSFLCCNLQNISDQSLHLIADNYQELEVLNLTRYLNSKPKHPRFLKIRKIKMYYLKVLIFTLYMDVWLTTYYFHFLLEPRIIPVNLVFILILILIWHSFSKWFSDTCVI